MGRIEIVDYHPRYAKAISDMWNCSTSGWNGRCFNSSELKVRKEEEGTTYLNLFLAVDESEVVGYAKFKLYPEEKDVCYIEMLNVVPTMHGRGIGKQLVQRCVLRAAELGFERIDLFTWAGNTKAVPLYKKCGFFWERMEVGVTHLMNFIPGLLNNKLFKPYFEVLNWYDDLVRDLEIAPDGRDELDFELYDYIWEKGDLQLKVSFEKHGRGIMAIKTPEFYISTFAYDPRPVFGLGYFFHYRIENYKKEPLEVSLQGENDAQIQYRFEHSEFISGNKDIESSFYIDPLEEELNEWKTYPGVITKLKINGNEIRMKCGLSIQYPLKTSFTMKKAQVSPNRENTMYLNVSNSFPFACHYQVTITDEAPLHLPDKNFEFRLEGFEKDFIPLRFSTSEATIFYPTLKITAFTEINETVRFDRKNHFPVFCLNSRAQRIVPDRYYLINSVFSLIFNQIGQMNHGTFYSTKGGYISFDPPQVGKPYSEEFDQELPYDVRVNDIGNANELVMYFRSRAYPDVEIARVYRLFSSGQLDCFIRIIKVPELEKDIFTNIRIGFQEDGLTFERNGRLICLEKDLPEPDIDCFDGEELACNWLFAKKDSTTCAIIWDKSCTARIDESKLSLDYNLGDYLSRGLTETEPICFFLDVFKSALAVRDEGEDRERDVEPIYSSVELVVNEGNPFLKPPYEVKLVRNTDEYLKGSFKLHSSDDSISVSETRCTGEEEIHSVAWKVDAIPKQPMLILKCEAVMPTYAVQRKQVVFHSSGDVRISGDDEKAGLITAENGLVSITAANDARLPGLISLKYKNQEWLDSGYPDYAPKSFQNPYQGGMGILPMMIRAQNMLKEKHTTNATNLKDQWDNLWEGIVISTLVKKNESIQGLEYKQYYLMLPGLPVMAVFTEIISKPKEAGYNAYTLSCSFQSDPDLKNNMIRIYTENERCHEIIAGIERAGMMKAAYHAAVRNRNSDTMLNIIGLNRTYFSTYVDPLVVRGSCNFYTDFVYDTPAFLPAEFVIFGSDDLNYDWMYPLLITKFSHP